jgi:hypothetical protein
MNKTQFKAKLLKKIFGLTVFSLLAGCGGGGSSSNNEIIHNPFFFNTSSLTNLPGFGMILPIF